MSTEPPTEAHASFHLLRLWLTMASAATIVVGVILVAAPEAPLLAGYNRSVAQAFWAQPQLPDAVRAYHRWTFGILGAAVAGWGVCNTCLLLYPFARRERWAFAALAGGIAAPHGLLEVVRSMLTARGLYLVAAVRVVFGVILVLVAPSSRAPRVLRLLGFIILVAGLTTPFFGVDRARAVLDWWSARGPALMRLWAGLAVALGAFVVYAVAPRRRAV